MSLRIAPGRLFLLGLGVDPEAHATMEVLQALGESSVAFVQGLDARQLKYLAGFMKKGGRLKAVPPSGPGEARAVSEILERLEDGRTAAWATLGHPFYWGSAAGRLVAECGKRGVAWKTFGAISPAGVALSEAGETLGTTIYGVQSFDYSYLAEGRAQTNPNWPMVVYFTPPIERKAFERCAAWIASQYPAAHPVLWCGSPSGKPGISPVSELGASFRRISCSAVLYLAARQDARSKVGRLGAEAQNSQKEVPSWVKE
ncbi:MAG: hypothetical protein HY921_02665 [Elusimicrobia bacterium]|nr:hypothetical protein [Elusimicrobiota bacterium]